MKLNISLLLALLISVQAIYAKNDNKISSNLEIKTGVLDNGLTYYLKRNPLSKGKADFYLLQKAGAILEEDSQNGLAHFLEHMCFKGTKHFPENSIFELLEKYGLKNNINAHTGVEETVYHMNNMPVADGMFIDKCLVILHDWCHYLNLEQGAIDSERPVIVEELRTRRDLSFRINEKISPFTMNHSKFSKRFIAGTPEIIKNFKREELERFYHKWYRPHMQAIVIIGDFELYEVEEKIKKLFSGIPTAKNPKPTPEIIIPDNDTTFYIQVEDPEIKDGEIVIKIRHKTDKNIKTKNLDNLINALYRRRFTKLMKEDSLSIKSASIVYAPLTKNYSEYVISVTHKTNMTQKALEKVCGVHNDILKNGFTQEEYNFITEKYLDEAQAYKKFSFSLPNKYYFEKIKYHFIHGEEILDPAEEYKILHEQFKETTLEDIKNRVNELYNNKNKTIIVLCNGSDEKYLTKEEVENIETITEPLQLLPDDEDDEDGENMRRVHLVNKKLSGSSIVKSEKIHPFATTKWTLENGATVIYKQSQDSRDVIDIYASSPGGSSVLTGDDYINSQVFANFFECFGAKGLNRDRMDKWLKDNEIQYRMQLSQDKEEISVRTRMKGLEKSFELLYSIFEQPAFYEDKYDEIFKNLKNQIEGIPDNYETKLKDTIYKLQYGLDRYVSRNNIINKTSLEKLENIYRDRYKDASNFTFYIVGGAGKKLIKQLSEKYIGSISSTHSNETYKNTKNPFPENYNKIVLNYDMVDAKAGNIYILDANMKLSYKDRLCFNLMSDYIQTILNKVLRQGINATYGVMVEKYINKPITNNSGVLINYEFDPENFEQVQQYINETLGFIAENGINETYFLSVKKKLKKELNIKDNEEQSAMQQQLKTNDYYLRHIIDVYERGEDNTELGLLKKTVKEIDLKYMKNFIIKFFSEANTIDLYYLPNKSMD